MLKALVVLCLSSLVVFAEGFTLKSKDFSGQVSNEQVFSGFGCSGGNVSPSLYWENVPKGTKSFAITFYDKDAPTGSGWWHWVAFNIPKEVTSLEKNSGDTNKNSMPKNTIQVKNDFGTFGFGGVCPPKGDQAHEYKFTIYALDVEDLGLDKNASAALVGFMINSHAIAKSSIISYYKR